MTYFGQRTSRNVYRQIRLWLQCWLLLSLLAIPAVSSAVAVPRAPNDTPQGGSLLSVNTTSDAGDGVCGVNECTLREAIIAANNDGTITAISFALPDSLQLKPTSPLPTITAPLTIDGTSQSGATCATPTVELNGGMAGAAANGLNITAGNSTVKGLIITRWSVNGIRLATGGTNTIECNWLGIAGNGNTAAGNAVAGIRVENSGSNTIGAAGAGNVISANGLQGIVISGSNAINNTVHYNIIGLGANATTELGNIDGIYIFNVPDNQVLNNTISKNLNSGIVVGGVSSVGTLIKGNYIGTNAAKKPLGNYSNGIVIDGAINTLVGGTTLADANVIGDNGNYGINLFNSTTSGTQIKGNYIGVATDGITSIPNFFNGIRAVGGSGSIGGTAVGEGNMIAFNKANGIQVGGTITATATAYTIVGNSVFANIKLGIDLDNMRTITGDGVTANDSLDADSGPNSLQNYPVLSGATANASQTMVTGSFNSTPNSTFNLDFYSLNNCDSTGFGEGRVYLGRQSVTTNGSGNATFTPLTLNTSVPAGQKITATATNPAGATSEFSNCVVIGNLPDLLISDAAIVEGNSGTKSLLFTVSLSTATNAPVVVQYTTSDNSAFTGLDYVAKTGTVTIPAGQTSVQISITIIGDTVYELNNETFLVNVLSASNASINKGAGIGTITDDDAAPTISISNASLKEGDVGTTTMIFTVTLSNASNAPITVDFATANGSATTPGDYLPSSGTLTFARDTTTQTIEVEIVGDVIDEPNETVLVNLSNSGAIVVSDAQGVGTITDNDAAPTLSIADASVAESNAGSKTMVFTVTSSAASGLPVTVNYATSNGTATTPADYVAANSSLTFAPGETSKLISITVNGDNSTEGNQTFNVTLSSPTNATLSDGTAIGTIIDAGTKVLIYLPIVIKNG